MRKKKIHFQMIGTTPEGAFYGHRPAEFREDRTYEEVLADLRKPVAGLTEVHVPEDATFIYQNPRLIANGQIYQSDDKVTCARGQTVTWGVDTSGDKPRPFIIKNEMG